MESFAFLYFLIFLLWAWILILGGKNLFSLKTEALSFSVWLTLKCCRSFLWFLQIPVSAPQPIQGWLIPCLRRCPCIAGCLKASLASVHYMPIACPQLWQPNHVSTHYQMSPGRQDGLCLRTTVLESHADTFPKAHSPVHSMKDQRDG